MKRLEVKAGDRYGRLTIIKGVETKNGNRYFECLCDCGNVAIERLHHLTKGITKSCGCYRKIINKNRKIHGHSNSTPTYNSWAMMKQRCYNSNRKDYYNYGGAGITVCERWRNSFENFLSDMGERPIGTTLDRYPNQSGIYEPDNCRWATIKEQNNNKRQRGHKTN
jgi:hypothetical protein